MAAKLCIFIMSIGVPLVYQGANIHKLDIQHTHGVNASCTCGEQLLVAD